MERNGCFREREGFDGLFISVGNEQCLEIFAGPEHGGGPVEVVERGGTGDVRREFFERGAGRGVTKVEGVDRFVTGRTSESDLDEHGRDERGVDCGLVGSDDSYG